MQITNIHIAFRVCVVVDFQQVVDRVMHHLMTEVGMVKILQHCLPHIVERNVGGALTVKWLDSSNQQISEVCVILSQQSQLSLQPPTIRKCPLLAKNCKVRVNIIPVRYSSDCLHIICNLQFTTAAQRLTNLECSNCSLTTQ